MKEAEFMFPNARIPYGTWGSSYFPAWQMSALAEVNIGQFAGEAMNRILAKRKVAKHRLDYLIVGSTVPWHWKFWNAPLVASCMGHRIPGFHIEQACATGLQAVLLAGAEVQSGANDVVGVLTFDRTSDSPVGVFPERRAYERTMALADVWDNFGFDPATGNAMITTAGIGARKYKLVRREVDELTLCRYESYFESKESGFLDRVLVPLEVLNVQGRPLGKIDDDYGVRQLSAESLQAMRELDNRLPRWNDTEKERRLWQLDRTINDRGVCIDVDLAEAAVKAISKEKKKRDKDINEATDGDVQAATRRDALIAHIKDVYGIEIPDLGAELTDEPGR